MITLEVLGTPAPKGSARAFFRPGMKHAVMAPTGSDANRRNQRAWDAAVRDQALLAVGDGRIVFVQIPIRVAIVFRMLRPGGHYSKATGKLLASAPAFPSSKPDIDKLARTTLDAMTGSIFDDDSRVASLHLDKIFAEPGREGATIAVAALVLQRHDDELARVRRVGQTPPEHNLDQDQGP